MRIISPNYHMQIAIITSGAAAVIFLMALQPIIMLPAAFIVYSMILLYKNREEEP